VALEDYAGIHIRVLRSKSGVRYMLTFGKNYRTPEMVELLRKIPGLRVDKGRFLGEKGRRSEGKVWVSPRQLRYLFTLLEREQVC